MQETERKRGEKGDLHLVANTGFAVLWCVVACGASRAVICWTNLCLGRSILCIVCIDGWGYEAEV